MKKALNVLKMSEVAMLVTFIMMLIDNKIGFVTNQSTYIGGGFGYMYCTSIGIVSFMAFIVACIVTEVCAIVLVIKSRNNK